MFFIPHYVGNETKSQRICSPCFFVLIHILSLEMNPLQRLILIFANNKTYWCDVCHGLYIYMEFRSCTHDFYKNVEIRYECMHICFAIFVGYETKKPTHFSSIFFGPINILSFWDAFTLQYIHWLCFSRN